MCPQALTPFRILCDYLTLTLYNIIIEIILEGDLQSMFVHILATILSTIIQDVIIHKDGLVDKKTSISPEPFAWAIIL
jgi:hypothetical protein